MLKLKKVKPFDVDGTLIIHGHNKEGVTFFNPNVNSECIAEPYWPMINLLKRLKNEGCSIIVWSHSGAEYTENLIEALKLEEYVDVIADKPEDYFDDEDCGYSKDGKGHQGWMGPRVILDEGDIYEG